MPERDMLVELENVMGLAARLAMEGKHEESSRMLILANNMMLQLLLGVVGGIRDLPEPSKGWVN